MNSKTNIDFYIFSRDNFCKIVKIIIFTINWYFVFVLIKTYLLLLKNYKGFSKKKTATLQWNLAKNCKQNSRRIECLCSALHCSALLRYVMSQLTSALASIPIKAALFKAPNLNFNYSYMFLCVFIFYYYQKQNGVDFIGEFNWIYQILAML